MIRTISDGCKKLSRDPEAENDRYDVSGADSYVSIECVGGCVGGPKALIDREIGREHVNQYGEEAPYPTPIDNPYVIELLHRLGFDTVESLLEKSDIFTRKF